MLFTDIYWLSFFLSFYVFFLLCSFSVILSCARLSHFIKEPAAAAKVDWMHRVCHMVSQWVLDLHMEHLSVFLVRTSNKPSWDGPRPTILLESFTWQFWWLLWELISRWLICLTLIRTEGGLARPPAQYKLVTRNVLGTGVYAFVIFYYMREVQIAVERLTLWPPLPALLVSADVRYVIHKTDTLCNLLLQHAS